MMRLSKSKDFQFNLLSKLYEFTRHGLVADNQYASAQLRESIYIMAEAER